MRKWRKDMGVQAKVAEQRGVVLRTPVPPPPTHGPTDERGVTPEMRRFLTERDGDDAA